MFDSEKKDSKTRLSSSSLRSSAGPDSSSSSTTTSVPPAASMSEDAGRRTTEEVSACGGEGTTRVMINSITDPLPSDVLFGRGKPYQGHAGNIRLRDIVERYKAEYSDARRFMKLAIAQEIVKGVQGGRWGEPGRFLRRFDEDGNEGHWVEADDTEAREKVSHALRGKKKNKKSPLNGEVAMPNCAASSGMLVAARGTRTTKNYSPADTSTTTAIVLAAEDQVKACSTILGGAIAAHLRTARLAPRGHSILSTGATSVVPQAFRSATTPGNLAKEKVEQERQQVPRSRIEEEEEGVKASCRSPDARRRNFIRRRGGGEQELYQQEGEPMGLTKSPVDSKPVGSVTPASPRGIFNPLAAVTSTAVSEAETSRLTMLAASLLLSHVSPHQQLEFQRMLLYQEEQKQQNQPPQPLPPSAGLVGGGFLPRHGPPASHLSMAGRYIPPLQQQQEPTLSLRTGVPPAGGSWNQRGASENSPSFILPLPASQLYYNPAIAAATRAAAMAPRGSQEERFSSSAISSLRYSQQEGEHFTRNLLVSALPGGGVSTSTTTGVLLSSQQHQHMGGSSQEIAAFLAA